MRKSVILAIITSMLMVSCSSSMQKDQVDAKNNEKLKQIVSENMGELEAQVYFDNTQSENKPQVAEQTVFIDVDELLGQYLMQTLIQGPAIKGTLNPVLPKDTKLISFTITDDVAIVNLSKEAVVKMTAAKEQACLESILATLTQLSSIQKVNIIVDNQMIESLGGNFDISKPFGKDDLNGLKK